VLPLQKKAL